MADVVAARTAVVALAVVLLAIAAAAHARTHPAAEHTAAAVAQPVRPSPEITFFPERGCGGLVDSFGGCRACIPIRTSEGNPVEGYLLTITEAGQRAVFFSGQRCTGKRMAEIRQNSCYCFAPPYSSVMLECAPPMADNNATLLDVGPQARGY